MASAGRLLEPECALMRAAIEHMQHTAHIHRAWLVEYDRQRVVCAAFEGANREHEFVVMGRVARYARRVACWTRARDCAATASIAVHTREGTWLMRDAHAPTLQWYAVDDASLKQISPSVFCRRPNEAIAAPSRKQE